MSNIGAIRQFRFWPHPFNKTKALTLKEYPVYSINTAPGL